ncbi:MAG: glycine oxidase ThiO [Pyrinomonadaceae bacterium]
MNSDILIIGAGVIGLSIARELHKKAVGKIIVVDRGTAGHGASWAAAGMLAPQSECDRIDDFYRLCTGSRDMYLDFANELVEETGVDIELDRGGTMYLAFTDHDVAGIRARCEWQRSAGLEIESLSAVECRTLEPAIAEDVREGLFLSNDWQVENRKLIAALIEFTRRNDIAIIENTRINSLLTNGDARSDDGGTFSAGQVIVATGAWTSLIKIGEAPLSVEVKPIRGQMICFKQSERQFKKVICSPRGYIVPRADGRVLAGATVEDVGFESVNTDEGIRTLRKHAAEISPILTKMRIADRWAGLRPYAADGSPVLGRLLHAQNLFVATAHYRNGILLAPVTAKIMADAIVDNRHSEFLQTFGPQRFRVTQTGPN